ncbi:MAG: LysM peptidoglycan-binding domain-containing protein [Pedosphaera sp.]|nr:LysM peptidoglycan-binding domain-containing protein [Pedosphaera sp.]
MNIPNSPLLQSPLQQRPANGKSSVHIVVFTTVALHAVFFSGLLMLGCGREKVTAKKAEPTNNIADVLPKLDTNAGYYSSFGDVPAVSTNVPATNEFLQRPPQSALATPTPPPPSRETLGESKEYTIVKGDTLGKIAKAHGVTLAALNNANPGLDSTKLRLAQKIQIPAASAAPARVPGLVEPARAETGDGKTHVVKAGENLTKIAKQHGTTAAAIRAANNMKTDQLLVGKKLKIPASSAPTASVKTNKSTSGSPLSLTNPDHVEPLRAGSTTTNLR